MPGPITRILTQAVPMEASEPSAFHALQLCRVIEMVDGARGVLEVTRKEEVDGAAREVKRFLVDAAVLAALPPGFAQLVAAAVARADCDPALAATRRVVTLPASADPLGARIDDIGKKFPVAAGTVAHVKTVFAGAVVGAAWWGLSVRLNPTAAAALAQVVGADLTTLLVLLAPAVPQAAVLLSITAAAGLGLKTWIEACNPADGRGVLVRLLMWVAPWVTPLD